MRERFKKWAIASLLATLLLVVSGFFIAVVTLNNSALLVTGSDIGITMVRTPIEAQGVALVLVILATFLIVYRAFDLKIVYQIIIAAMTLILFTLSMHNFVWNYTQQKVEDIWFLISVQEVPTVKKTADVNCQISKYWFELEHSSGAKISVFRGFYPWRLARKELISGCKNKKELEAKKVH